MKKLALAAVLSLAALPVIASTSIVANDSNCSSGSSCCITKHWVSTGCPDIITVYNYASHHCHRCLTVLVSVSDHQNSGSSATSNGSDAIVLNCNGNNFTVQPGSSFVCKTTGNVTWHDVGSPCPSAYGKYTIKLS